MEREHPKNFRFSTITDRDRDRALGRGQMWLGTVESRFVRHTKNSVFMDGIDRSLFGLFSPLFFFFF